MPPTLLSCHRELVAQRDRWLHRRKQQQRSRERVQNTSLSLMTFGDLRNNVCWEMLALCRVRVGSGFIKAQAAKALGDGAVTHSPCVCTQTHIYAHRFDSCVWTEQPCLWPFLQRSTASLRTCTFPSALSLPLRLGSMYMTSKYGLLAGGSDFIKSQMKVDCVSWRSLVTQ